jgi:hypothetical protein
MRLNLSRVAVALGGAVGVGGIAASVAVGCGGDDNVVPTQDSGGPDRTGIDAPIDNYQPPIDGYVPDGNDGGTGPADGNVPSPDVIDAPTLNDFINQQDIAYCTSFGECCTPSPQYSYPFNWNNNGDGDGGPLGCIPFFNSVGGFNSLGNYQASIGDSYTTYNPAQADKCIYDLQEMYVNSTQNLCGVLDAGTINGIFNDCFAAITGNQANGQPCNTSLDCANGYCQFVNDAGTTCAALVTVGNPCTLNGNAPNGPFIGLDEQCSYLGRGVPANFCNFANSDGGPVGVCAPALPAGSPCQLPTQCQSLNCPTTATQTVCVDNVVFSDPGIDGGNCSFFITNLDGG